jgi:uncharacterized protein with PQ loop repeat
MDGQIQNHIHLRKRLFKKLEEYPHPDQTIRKIDELAYVFGIAGPLFSIPQLYAIWSTHDAKGVSLISWSAFTVGSLFWLFYGLTHKEKPIIISQSLWFILQLIIVIGIILYR